ncbi:hypothetical protein SMACR_09526 [Sordaria macrospora]|uniref:WGS project CABT00000000 data, contig 2.54 n=2 Tax=Sordaria macrospora TaxID=5147 RepID=F7W9Q0_SORMK|nr:uncharacterized protein SMAC_09526 [Sordaria macrospora k-hell]KAA8632186.1 hypothetical protein SMACR_09526 [Sordaria macrospora]WPJ57148.1 hypothetical protein SMAC4_09526 [Sordaria macrospora]CCC14041.1 unnamed protein product [Sordaria macrospora k-hell]
MSVFDFDVASNTLAQCIDFCNSRTRRGENTRFFLHHRQDLARERQEAQQALQQAKQKDAQDALQDARVKLDHVQQERRQQEQEELQLSTRHQVLQGQTQQQATDRQALEEEKAVLATDRQALEEEKAAVARERQIVEEEKAARTFEELENVSERVDTVQAFIEVAGQTNDRLAAAQTEAASTTSLIDQRLTHVVDQQLESIVSKLGDVQGVAEGTNNRLALIEDVAEGTGLHDRLTSIKNEIDNGRRALDDIRIVVTTENELLKTRVDALRQRNLELTLQLESYCGIGATESGSFNHEWLALVNEVRRNLLSINVSKPQGCDLRTILYHIAKAVQNRTLHHRLAVFRVASQWNDWYCWEDVMNRGQDAVVVEGPYRLHQNGACFQVKRVEEGFSDLLVFRGPNLGL